MPIYKTEGKKGGKQKYRVRVSFVDAQGNYKQAERTVYGFEEAKLLEMQLSKKIKEQPPDSRMTIEQLYNEYIEVKKQEVRTTSWDKSKRVLERHVIPDIGGMRIDKLSSADIQRWKLRVSDKNTNQGQPLKLKTKQNIYKELAILINYAVKMEYIPRNPMTIVGNFKDTGILTEPLQYYTADEFLRFIKAARSAAENAEPYEWHYYVFFNIAYFTGMRKGEISALQWDDIDGEYINITRSISQKTKGGDIETPPKNRTSVRTLQAPAPLLKVLNEHKELCQSMGGFDESQKVCGGKIPLRDSTVQNRNKAYSKAAGIKTIRIHDFRHSHASLLANEGINIQEIARRLGHAKIEMTLNTYSHLYPREEERAIAVLNRIQG